MTEEEQITRVLSHTMTNLCNLANDFERRQRLNKRRTGHTGSHKKMSAEQSNDHCIIVKHNTSKCSIQFVGIGK